MGLYRNTRGAASTSVSARAGALRSATLFANGTVSCILTVRDGGAVGTILLRIGVTAGNSFQWRTSSTAGLMFATNCYVELTGLGAEFTLEIDD